MRYIESDSTDPRWNLALEQYVFDRLDRKEAWFMLWRNADTIVIGKYQNAAAEINAGYVREHGITVVRRLSGGGAVYHDLGNLNYTFITDADGCEEVRFERFCRPVLRVLHRLGVDAELSGRNDITIGGRKCSGSAQYVRDGRVMHHGTLMFHSDLDAVNQALHASDEKLTSKGIASVRSRVTNISDHLSRPMTLEEFKDMLLAEVSGEAGLIPWEPSEEDRLEIDKLRRERYDSWEWNFGRSPAFSTTRRRRFDGCGTVEVSLSVEEGLIRSLAIFGDFFGSEDPDELSRILTGCRCRKDDVERRLAGCRLDRYIQGCSPGQLAELIAP